MLVYFLILTLSSTTVRKNTFSSYSAQAFLQFSKLAALGAEFPVELFTVGGP